MGHSRAWRTPFGGFLLTCNPTSQGLTPRALPAAVSGYLLRPGASRVSFAPAMGGSSLDGCNSGSNPDGGSALVNGSFSHF